MFGRVEISRTSCGLTLCCSTFWKPVSCYLMQRTTTLQSSQKIRFRIHPIFRQVKNCNIQLNAHLSEPTRIPLEVFLEWNDRLQKAANYKLIMNRRERVNQEKLLPIWLTSQHIPNAGSFLWNCKHFMVVANREKWLQIAVCLPNFVSNFLQNRHMTGEAETNTWSKIQRVLTNLQFSDHWNVFELLSPSWVQPRNWLTEEGGRTGMLHDACLSWSWV
jgi:hypothetical protein